MINQKHARQMAIHYHILKRLVQDDALLNRVITKDNIKELGDAKAFYLKHFESRRFIEHFPTVFKLIQRETEAAFKRLSKRLLIVHRYEPEYPSSLWQDFKDDAPMFLYVSGTLEPLDRKADRLAFFTTNSSSDAYINACMALIAQLKQQNFTIILQFVSLMDNLMFLNLQKLDLSCMVFMRGPITLDLEAAIKKFNPRFKRGRKGLNIFSVTGPFNEPMEENIHIKLLNSLSKLSVLFSEDPKDAARLEIQNNLSWRKPSMMPLIDGKQYPSSDLLFTLKSPQDFLTSIQKLMI